MLRCIEVMVKMVVFGRANGTVSVVLEEIVLGEWNVVELGWERVFLGGHLILILVLPWISLCQFYYVLCTKSLIIY